MSTEETNGANIGEWSEVYTFFKLLGEGKVYAGDQNLKKIESLVFPIIQVIHQERDKELRYGFSPEDRKIVILKEDGEELLNWPADEFEKHAYILLDAIKECIFFRDENRNRKKKKQPLVQESELKYVSMDKKGSFKVPLIENWLKRIRHNSKKSSSSNKQDIRIVMHDCRTQIESEIGFSIKSYLGGNPTLLNASGTTMVSFIIKGNELSDTEISKINAIEGSSKIKRRIEAVYDNGSYLTPDQIKNENFRNNLIMIDSRMPEMLSELMILWETTDNKTISDLVSALKINNPMKYSLASKSPFYEYKFKQLLTCIALGMQPGTPWDGIYDANGGFIVVKEDGDLVCYHFYDRNRFEDYLFYGTMLERASSSKYKVPNTLLGKSGCLERGKDGIVRIYLPLQIRFK